MRSRNREEPARADQGRSPLYIYTNLHILGVSGDISDPPRGVSGEPAENMGKILGKMYQFGTAYLSHLSRNIRGYIIVVLYQFRTLRRP